MVRFFPLHKQGAWHSVAVLTLITVKSWKYATNIYIYIKFKGTKDGQLLDDIFIGRQNFLCPERDLNPRPPDYRLDVITTTLSEQPCWLHGQSTISGKSSWDASVRMDLKTSQTSETKHNCQNSTENFKLKLPPSPQSMLK